MAVGAPPGSVRPVVGAAEIGPLKQAGDVLTLATATLAPFSGLGLAGITYGDVCLALALLARGAAMAAVGLPLLELRRHQYLLFVFGLFTFGGMLSGFFNGQPMPWDFIRIVVAMVGALFLVATYGSSRQELLPLVKAVALGSAILGLSTLVGGDDGNGRALGYSIHPNLLGHSCVMGLAACGYLIDNGRDRRSRWLWLGGAALNAFGILQSGSRGALLAVWAGGLLYLCFARRPRLVIAAVLVSWLLVLTLASGVVALPEDNPVTRLFEGNDASTQGSDRERAAALESSFAAVSEHPLFGEGFVGIVRIHVVYYQGWVGGGAIGGFSLILLGATMLVLPIGQPRRLLALPCGAAAIAVAWLFTNILSTRDQWIFIVLAFRCSASPFRSLVAARAARR